MLILWQWIIKTFVKFRLCLLLGFVKLDYLFRQQRKWRGGRFYRMGCLRKFRWGLGCWSRNRGGWWRSLALSSCRSIGILLENQAEGKKDTDSIGAGKASGDGAWRLSTGSSKGDFLLLMLELRTWARAKKVRRHNSPPLALLAWRWWFGLGSSGGSVVANNENKLNTYCCMSVDPKLNFFPARRELVLKWSQNATSWWDRMKANTGSIQEVMIRTPLYQE